MLGKNFLGKTEFGQKIWIRFFFCLKKQVGLTQGGGYMTPPQKIVGFNCVGLLLVWLGKVAYKISDP